MNDLISKNIRMAMPSKLEYINYDQKSQSSSDNEEQEQSQLIQLLEDSQLKEVKRTFVQPSVLLMDEQD